MQRGTRAWFWPDGAVAFGAQPAAASHKATQKTARRAGMALDMNHPWVSSREEIPFRRYSLPGSSALAIKPQTIAIAGIAGTRQLIVTLGTAKPGRTMPQMFARDRSGWPERQSSRG